MKYVFKDKNGNYLYKNVSDKFVKVKEERLADTYDTKKAIKEDYNRLCKAHKKEFSICQIGDDIEQDFCDSPIKEMECEEVSIDWDKMVKLEKIINDLESSLLKTKKSIDKELNKNIRYGDIISEKIRQCDMAVNDLLHYIERVDIDLSDNQYSNFGKLTRKYRIARRTAKNELKLLNTIQKEKTDIGNKLVDEIYKQNNPIYTSRFFTNLQELIDSGKF